jgi:hypothetical protein
MLTSPVTVKFPVTVFAKTSVVGVNAVPLIVRDVTARSKSAVNAEGDAPSIDTQFSNSAAISAKLAFSSVVEAYAPAIVLGVTLAIYSTSLGAIILFLYWS